MEQEFLDKLEAMDLGDRQPSVEKGLLDLPVNLMYEVFGPLDARSLLETANSHILLQYHVAWWPGKNWDVVFRSRRTILIDNDIFESQGAGVLLQNAVYNQENRSAVTETSTNICDLPYDLLWPILEPLDVKDLLEVAKSHPNFLRATRNMRNKRFSSVECCPEKVIFCVGYGPYYRETIWTHQEAELLLAGATVASLKYDVQADISPDVRVQSLTIQGDPQHAHKCAGLIEKSKPRYVAFPKWDAEAFSANPGLARALKDVPLLRFGVLSIDWLDYIPEWKFTSLVFSMEGKDDVTPQIQLMCQKLHDQWKAGERGEFCMKLLTLLLKIRSFDVGAMSTSLLYTRGVKRPDGLMLTLRKGLWFLTMTSYSLPK